MFSRSCLDLLNLLSVDDFCSPGRIPRVMTAEGVLCDFETDMAGASPGVLLDRRIVVANQLPVRAVWEQGTGKWGFEWDWDSLVLQLKDGLRKGSEVVYVGSLAAEVVVADQEEVIRLLWDGFRCVPTFLPSDLRDRFYHGFCKHYLWPLFHYMLPMSQSQGTNFDHGQWQAYLTVNRMFADKIMEVINPDDDYVWIHDYHLMVLPTFLRRRFSRVKVGFFLHSPFPSSEIYRTMPVRDEVLRALLNCDLIGFHTFDYARHFLSCCSRMLGIDYESKRGYIGLDYYGRTVSIKILPVGIHMGQLESILSVDEMAERVKRVREQYKGKIVILGVDDLDLFKGISLKFLGMGKLLELRPELRGKVVLVQITNPARSSGKDVQQVEDETNLVADEINRKYGEPGYDPIVYIKGPVTMEEKAAYYCLAECVIVNAVRDGMNLVPYTYTVCRQGSPAIDRALGNVGDFTPRRSMIIVSEFIGCSPSLSGAIRVNPWNIDCVAEAMNSAITIPLPEKQMRHEKHYKYISGHDVLYWARSFDQDLVRACRDHYSKRFWRMGFGLGFRVVAMGPSFKKLFTDRLVSAYGRTSNRLILLDYDGTLLPKTSINKRPSSQVLSILDRLSSDPNNIVFIISGRGKDSLSSWFDPCKRLGLSAEHGYFTRWSKDLPWETCALTTDFNWKKLAAPVMDQYTEATDGSFVETKETALVWHHQEADPHFGGFQAKELLDHLESVLANEPVIVKRGQHIVEVKPQGISKGAVVDGLVTAMKSRGKSPDFLLCIGDDQSDEDMFESITGMFSNPLMMSAPTAEVFTCTVGQKPSRAKYYLEGVGQVLGLLEVVAEASKLDKGQAMD